MLNAYANTDPELMKKCTSKFCVKYLDNEVIFKYTYIYIHIIIIIIKYFI